MSFPTLMKRFVCSGFYHKLVSPVYRSANKGAWPRHTPEVHWPWIIPIFPYKLYRLGLSFCFHVDFYVFVDARLWRGDPPRQQSLG